MCCSASMAIRTWPISDTVRRCGLRRQHQLVGGPVGDLGIVVGGDAGGRVDGGQRGVCGLLRRHRQRGIRAPILAAVRQHPRLAVRSGRKLVVGGRVVRARPGPDVGAVPDDVGFAQRAEQRQPLLVLAGIPDPQGVRTGDQRGEIGAPPATHLYRQFRQTEIGGLHNGPGQRGHIGGLHVDQQFGGRCGVAGWGWRRQSTAVSPAAAEHDGDNSAGHRPAKGRVAGGQAHGQHPCVSDKRRRRESVAADVHTRPSMLRAA